MHWNQIVRCRVGYVVRHNDLLKHSAKLKKNLLFDFLKNTLQWLIVTCMCSTNNQVAYKRCGYDNNMLYPNSTPYFINLMTYVCCLRKKCVVQEILM